MASVSEWLVDSCLHLNLKKTVCMYFSNRSTSTSHPHVTVNGNIISVVEQFKYLGIILDPHLTFKDHVKKVVNMVKFGISNFKIIRPYIPTEAAKLYMHGMILSHIKYCLTNWCQTGVTSFSLVESLYKQTLKVLDNKPRSYHHCFIISKYNLLSIDNLKIFADLCLVYKILNGLAPPPLRVFITTMDENIDENRRITRSVTRGDCAVSFRNSTFTQNVFSVRASAIWNKLPLAIRNCTNFNTFKVVLKGHLKSSQACTHH